MGRPAELDWAWATSTGGNLTPQQKRALLAPLVRTVLRYPGSRIRTALGRRGTASLDLDALTWPDSALARDSVAEIQETLSPWVVDHSFRTWILGRLLAQIEGVEVDHEVTFVGSILHDLTLEHRTEGRCFAVTGGEHAQRFATEHGAGPEQAAAIGAAVGGHITVGAAEDLADPAGFVSAGAFLDITGFGLHRIDPAFTDELHRRHPRDDLRRKLLKVWAAEGKAVPDGRARWITRYGAFPLLLRAAPYAE